MVVFKAYDCQYVAQLRRDYRTIPWSCAVEEQHRRFAQAGNAERFIAMLEYHEEEYADEIAHTVPQDVVHQEAYLQHEMRKIFKTEVQAYQCLVQHQGRHFPVFYGSVRVHDSGGFNEYADFQGILIE